MVEIHQLKDRDYQMDWGKKKKKTQLYVVRKVHSKYKDTGDLRIRKIYHNIN